MLCRCGSACNCTNSSGTRPRAAFDQAAPAIRRRCGPSCRYTAGKRNGETMTSKAVVLLSGGMDSCVTAAIAAEQHGAEGLALLHAAYGQRTEPRERRAFYDIAGFYCAGGRPVGALRH